VARFEHGDHPKRKFWEFTLKGSVVSTATGKVGMTTSRMDGKTRHHSGPDKTSERDFKTVEAARRAYDKLLAEKQAAGCDCVESDPAPSTAVALRDAALEAALLDARDTPAPYLVYGDWLQERGDPRGELIALHHAMQGQVDSSRFFSLRQQDRALHLAHDRAWLGSELVDARYRTRLDWRLGFVNVARLDARSFPAETPLGVLVTALLAAPAGCAVHHLILRTPRRSQDGPTRVTDEATVQEIADALAQVRAPVRAVDVHCHSWKEPAQSAAIRERAAATLRALAVTFDSWNE